MIVLKFSYICFLVFVSMFVRVSYAVIDPNTCVGKWTLNEGKGDVVKDSSGKGNHGIIINNAIWVDGYLGKALEFNKAKANYVKIPNDKSLNGDELTVMLWIKPIALTGDWNNFITKWFTDAGEDVDWHFSIRGDGGYRMNIYLTWAVQSVYANSKIPEGKWSHCAFTVNKSGDIKFYLNGEPDGEKLGTAGRTAINSKAHIYLSDHRSCCAVDGIIDEVAIYNVPLSQEDIQSAMKGFISVSPVSKLATTWAEMRTK